MTISLSFLSACSLLSLTAAQSLLDVLSSQAGFSTLVSVLPSYPDLVETLGNASNITVLAPVNFALAAFLETEEGARFQSDPEYAQALLSYHVLQGTYSSEYIQSIQPSTLGAVFFPTLLGDGPFSNVSGGQTVEGTPGTFRVTDPTNVTFFSGFVYDSNWAQEELLDLPFDGGVVHGINPLLTLPPNISTCLVAAQRESLLGAIQRVGLLEAIESRRDITFFAPTNQGFQNIGSKIPDLSDDDLRDILLYHVAITDETLYGVKLRDGLRLPTLGGGDITITIQNQTQFSQEQILTEDQVAFVNGARIINFNFPVENGVVFGIDNILNPANTTAVPPPNATAGQRQFGDARAGTVFPYTEGVRTTDNPIFSATNPGNSVPPGNTPTALAETQSTTGIVTAAVGGNRTTATSVPSPVQYTGGVAATVTQAPVLGAAVAVGAMWMGL